jgi:hypothetical protein
VLAEVETVKVEELPEVIEAGLNDQEAPEGRPDKLKVTVCALPLVVEVFTI